MILYFHMLSGIVRSLWRLYLNPHCTNEAYRNEFADEMMRVWKPRTCLDQFVKARVSNLLLSLNKVVTMR